MSSTEYASFDLHLHTSWSYDATAQVESHFRRARELGVQCIAITEHHCLDSQPQVREVAAGYQDVRFLPAAELSATTSIGAVDLLCYGFPDEVSSELKEVLDAYHQWQQDYGAAISRGMCELGHDYSDQRRMELLKTYRSAAAIDVQGNTHVKNGLQQDNWVDRGFITSPAEYGALRKQAAELGKAPPYPAVEDVVPAVKKSGAVVCIAHPHGYFAQGDKDRMAQLVKECSLDGIECAHPSVPADFTPYYRNYCVEHNLLPVGGSDCHTDEDVQEKFAIHIGEDEWLDALLARIDGA